jgi:hypothetical protein
MAKQTKKKVAKRELIKPNGDARYVRRDKAGRFNENDDVGKSQAQDRKKKAKRAAQSGKATRDRK